MPSQGFSRAVRFVLLVVPFFAAVSVQAASVEDSSAFVQQLGDRTIEVLTNESYSAEDRMVHYRQLLREGFAVNTIARFALGRYWRAASPAVREEYLVLFQEFVLDIYSKRLDSFSGETFTIIKALSIDKTDTMVSTEIGGGGGPPIRVDYRVRVHGDTLQIVDVLVEGISLIITQRSEFASIINRDGLDGLLEKLRRYNNN